MYVYVHAVSTEPGISFVSSVSPEAKCGLTKRNPLRAHSGLRECGVVLFVVGGAGRRVVFGVCEPLSEREGERGREEERERERESERGRERGRENVLYMCV